MKDPVVTTFATADPYTVPVIPDATTAALAGPPVLWPVSEIARSTKNLPTPERIKIAPKMINKTMYVDATYKGIPYIPSDVINKVSIYFASLVGGP